MIVRYGSSMAVAGFHGRAVCRHFNTIPLVMQVTVTALA